MSDEREGGHRVCVRVRNGVARRGRVCGIARAFVELVFSPEEEKIFGDETETGTDDTGASFVRERCVRERCR